MDGKRVIKINLMNLLKNILNINKDSIPFDEQRKIFNELVEERFTKFKDSRI